MADLFSGLFGAAGSIIGASIQSDAVKDATKLQLDALKRQQDFVYNQLNPDLIGAEYTKANQANALARLVLQGKVDPDLLSARYTSEAALKKGAEELGKTSTLVSDQAVKEALADRSKADAGKNALIDSALEQLKLGATLPPDVQSELVQAGLERSGMTTGAASGKGMGGQLLRTILGNAGLALKQQRETQAANLLSQASNLEAQRSSILQTLFPKLAETQLQTLQGQAGVLNAAESLKPQSGMTGTDVANIWLARVGATNSLLGQQGTAAANQSYDLGKIWSAGAGGAATGIGSALSAVLNNTSTTPKLTQAQINAA
jgi:hypothetical protein